MTLPDSTNRIARATAYEDGVRAYAIEATRTVAELQERHGTYPAVTAALGRTAMGALLLAAATLKRDENLLTVEVNGRGPAGRILCTANGRGEVRGMVARPAVHAESVNGKLNVAGVVGTSGYLSVSRQIGEREPYRGMVELQSGEIGEDLAHYLARSEQTPSAVGIGVFVERDGSVAAAGGFLVQILPQADDDLVVELERRIAGLPHPTELIRAGLSPEEILGRIFPEGYRPLEGQDVRFHCPCTRDRFERAIVSLGQPEVTRLVEEEGDEETEVVCHFCNEAYRFSRGEMLDILRKAS